MAIEIDCQNGPVACGADDDGNDIFCMDGYACFQSVFGDKCDDVARYQCNVDCGAGNTLNPLRYCTCITEEERDGMFCAPEGSGSSTDSGDGMEQMTGPLPGAPITIHCDANNTDV